MLEVEVTVGHKTKVFCLVRYIFYSFNVKKHTRASNLFSVPKTQSGNNFLVIKT